MRRGRPARKARVGVDRAAAYRLYPTARQSEAFGELFACQRELYNAALEQRRGVWRWEHRRVTRDEQFRELTGAQGEFSWLARFGVGVARGTLVRLDEAFAHFFRRVRAGGRSGFPRFKSPARWDSVQWGDTNGWKLVATGKGTYGRLYVQGVGHVKVKLHRRFPAPARPAKLVVRRRGARLEAIVFWRNVAAATLPPVGKAAGMDLGVRVLVAVADSDGHVLLIDNPAPLTHTLERLADAQRAVAACAPGSGRRRRARQRVTRFHQRAARLRRGHAHQVSARLVRDYDALYIEDLRIANMTRSAKGTLEAPGRSVAAKAGLNRAILDAGWGQLIGMVTYKAAGAGRTIMRVPAAYTSQTCARCGHTDPESRDRDRFWCRACGNRAHADANSAAVILGVGLGHLTLARRETSARTGPPAGDSENATQPDVADREARRR